MSRNRKVIFVDCAESYSTPHLRRVAALMPNRFLLPQPPHARLTQSNPPDAAWFSFRFLGGVLTGLLALTSAVDSRTVPFGPDSLISRRTEIIANVAKGTWNGTITSQSQNSGEVSFTVSDDCNTINDLRFANISCSIGRPTVEIPTQNLTRRFSFSELDFSCLQFDGTFAIGSTDRIIGSARLSSAFSDSCPYACNLSGDWRASPTAPGASVCPITVGTRIDIRYPFDIDVKDVDGDGALDVLVAGLLGNNGRIGWYTNLDGTGSFDALRIIDTVNSGSVVGVDLEGDGDLDVLTRSGWYSNLDGRGQFGPIHTFNTQSFREVTSVYSADLDGDRDMDVLFAAYRDRSPDGISWHENLNRAGFGAERAIGNGLPFAYTVYAADLDTDRDVDVLAANYDSKLVWYENTDGRGAFSPEQVISNQSNRAKAIFSADLDGDGDPDVLTAEVDGNQVVWHENLDGKGTFGPEKVISNSTRGASDVDAADLDADGDQDVLAAH